MLRRSRVALPVLVVPLALVGCGGSMTDSSSGTVSTNGAPAHLITISGMTFMPARLQVTPGSTVTVRNMDSTAHSVTSEAAMNAFRPGTMGGVSFDTGPFMGEMSFTISPAAAAGMVVPYFSTVDTSMMATPNGEIEIVPAASMPMPMPMDMPTGMPM
jgi:plastocyanin